MGLNQSLKLIALIPVAMAIAALGVQLLAFDQLVAFLERYVSSDGHLKESTKLALAVRLVGVAGFCVGVAALLHACADARFREDLRRVLWYDPASPRAPRPARTSLFLSVVVAVLALMSLAGQYLRYELGMGDTRTGLFVYHYFNLDQEHWVPTTFSALLLLYAGLLLANVTWRTRSQGGAFVAHWGLLSLAFVFLAGDEKFRVHERAFDFLIPYVDVGLPVFWVVPAGVLVLIGVLFYLRFLFNLPLAYQVLFVTCGAMYLSGAIGMEIVGRAFANEHGIDNFSYELLANVEEILEMLAIVLFITTLQGYLQQMRSGVAYAPAPAVAGR